MRSDGRDAWRPVNLTRRSASIPRRLAREGAFHLLPVYYLLRLSDLAREGMDHSGSYRFADHIYAGKASGRTPVGRWIDARLLQIPAAQAFRRRCEYAQSVIRRVLLEQPVESGAVRVLSIPCGIPRDIITVAEELQGEDPEALSRLEYYGVDIDPAAVALARRLTRTSAIRLVHFRQGDALRHNSYPPCRFHVVVSTGLGEFLDDQELTRMYANVHESLEPGGTFFTSATALDARSDALLRMAELLTHYRAADEIRRLITRLPWAHVQVTRDPSGLQTFVEATK